MEINIYNWRKAGIKIGNNCHIYSSLPETRDCFLLEIGDNVTISVHVSFFLHDASIDVPSSHTYTDLLGKIIVGNNSFIGANAIIMPGVSIAEGTIIAAGSVVTKSIDKPNMVVGGNPARYISTSEDFFKKNEEFGFNLDGKSKEDIIKEIENGAHSKLIRKKNMS